MTKARKSGGEIAKLFKDWLALRQRCETVKEDGESERLNDEMMGVERAILSGTAETEADRQAQLAILTEYLTFETPYANVDVREDWYRRHVIEQIADPAARQRALGAAEKRMQRAKEHLAELAADDPAEPAVNENRPRDAIFIDDPHVAGIYRAIAIRFYSRYVDMRHCAAHRGGDIADHGPLPTPLEADDRYEAAVKHAIHETPDSADAALALVEFAAVLAADRLMGEALGEPVNDERDAYDQSVALAAAGSWLNKLALNEFTQRVRAKRSGQ